MRLQRLVLLEYNYSITWRTVHTGVYTPYSTLAQCTHSAGSWDYTREWVECSRILIIGRKWIFYGLRYRARMRNERGTCNDIKERRGLRIFFAVAARAVCIIYFMQGILYFLCLYDNRSYLSATIKKVIAYDKYGGIIVSLALRYVHIILSVSRSYGLVWTCSNTHTCSTHTHS